VPTTNAVAPVMHVETRQAVLRVGDHSAEHVLGKRPVEHAAGVGHHDVRLAQLVEEQRVDARRGDVNPRQPVRL
jgi:hypothetical protein